jgi:hypothetical protein
MKKFDLPGWQVISQPGQVRELMARAGERGALRIIYRPEDGDPVAHWECVGSLAYERGRMVIAIDEVDMFCSPWSWKMGEFWKRRSGTPALQKIVNWGRNRQLSMIVSARNPSAVHRDLTRNAWEWCLFADREPNDRAYFEASFSRLAVDMLDRLKRHQWVEQTKATDPAIRGPLKIRA